MAARKTIELKFSDDNSVNCREVASPTGDNHEDDDSVKRLDFGGLIIEVRETKKSAKKPVLVHLINSGEGDENKSPNEVVATTNNHQTVKTRRTSDDDFVIVTSPSKANIPKVPPKPAHLRSNPVEPKQAVLSLPLLDVDHVAVTGAAGLWAQEKTTKEPPPVTDEDWKIFKQHMAPPPEPPCYTKLLEMNNKKLNKNQEDFMCSICEIFIKKGQGVVLKGCLHNFCRICLVDTINENHDTSGQVKCPFTVEPCENIIDDNEVRDLLGDSAQAFFLKVFQALHDETIAKEREEEAEKYAMLPALLNADNFDYIENFEVFECQICLEEIHIGKGIILKDCLHKFCQECLIEQVKHSDEVAVKCPNNDEDGSCTSTLQEREIRGLVPADIFNKHLEKSLKLYEGTSEKGYHCKTPDCRGFIEIEENVRGFTCEVCDKVNCIGCKAIHQGKNCQEYQFEINPNGEHQRANAESEIAIKNMIIAGDAMYCPKCGIPVVKSDGCDFITCTTCRLGICWRTKKPRNAIRKETGEIIDGCHCNENGVRCHPQCGNCH